MDVIGTKVFSSLLFKGVSTKGFYSPPAPLSKSGLKLVCNVNTVYGNLMSETSQDYAQKPSMQLYVHEFGLAGLPRQKLAAEQLQNKTSGIVRQGRRHGPSITAQISSGWVTLLQPARRASVSGHLSRLLPHCLSHMLYFATNKRPKEKNLQWL